MCDLMKILISVLRPWRREDNFGAKCADTEDVPMAELRKTFAQ
jgi:hypothetical protein